MCSGNLSRVPRLGSGQVQQPRWSRRRALVWLLAVLVAAIYGSSATFAPALAGASANTAPLTYHGGAVLTAKPEVYLIYWGSNWGTQGTDPAGDWTFSNDRGNELIGVVPRGPNLGVAPGVQQLFAGLGTGGERWSSILTQYCASPRPGATSCPATSQHISYPTGGVLAGRWYDNHTDPKAVTDRRVHNELDAAAEHFGNNTAAANSNTIYILEYAPGSSWNNGTDEICADHSTMPDASLGALHYIELPANAACEGGEDPKNLVDNGATVNAAHEYAETLTDPDPQTDAGWYSRSASQGEIADVCQYLRGDQYWEHGTYLTLTSGRVYVPDLWSNDTGSCVHSHATITDPTAASRTRPTPRGANDIQSSTAGAHAGHHSSTVRATMIGLCALLAASPIAVLAKRRHRRRASR